MQIDNHTVIAVSKMKVESLNNDQRRHDYSPQSRASATPDSADIELGSLGGNSSNDGDLSVDASQYASISQGSGLSLSTYDFSGRNLNAINGSVMNANRQTNGEHPVVGNHSADNTHAISPHSSPQVRPHSSPHISHRINHNSSPQIRPFSSPHGSLGTSLRSSSPHHHSIQLSPQQGSPEQAYITPSKTDLSDETDATFDNSPSPPLLKFRKKSIRFSVENEVRTYTPNPEEFVDNPGMQVNLLMPTCGTSVRQFFAKSALPFTYGATSSLTTLFFLYELMNKYRGRNEIIGIYLVGAYLCRVIFNSISRYAPKTFVLIGSISALVGFVAIFISQAPEFMDIDKKVDFDDDGLALFIAGSILANCNETIGAMQIFVKDQYSENAKAAGSGLKIHFLMAKLARIGSFLGGGLLYHYYGVHCVAAFGAGMVSLQIVVLVSFLILDNYRIPHNPLVMNAHKPKCRMTCSVRAARGRRRIFKSSLSKLNRTLSKYYPSGMPPSTVRYMVPICIFGRTASSICIWNSSTIIMVHEFEKDFITVGAVFAAAAGFDFLVSLFILKGSQSGEVSQLSVNHVFICMAGISLGSVVVAVPNFYAFVSGFMVYAICNSMLRIAMIDLQGTSNNATEGIMVQLIRRFQTAAALYCIPLLFKMHPRLPLVLALWFALLSSVVLIWVLACCKKSEETIKVDDDVEKRKDKSRSIKRRSSKPERNLIYSERAMLGRLITGKDV